MADGGGRIADFCGVEFGADGFEGGVVDGGVGLAVDFDAQFFAGGVGAQVDDCCEGGAHKASGVVVAAERFAGELDEGGFGAVGDELDCVDVVFSASAQTSYSLLGREVFDLDVFCSGFAPGFEGFESRLFALEGLEGGSFFLLRGGLRLRGRFPASSGLGRVHRSR